LSIDKFGRNIDYLRISVTDRCNLRCVYCMPENGIKLCPHNEILSYEEIFHLVKIFTKIGIKKIRITGGEPLIRRNLSYLIGKISELQEIKDIAITTNGILLKELINELYNAGLKRVNVSLDTLKADRFERITKMNGLVKVISGIERCLELGLTPIKINTVLMKGVNDDEIIDFVRMTEKNPFHIRFIEYMPWGRVDVWDVNKVIKTKEVIEKIEREFGKLEPVESKSGGPAVNYRIKGFLGLVGFINPVSSHFCNLCNRIRLTADGKLRLCLFSENEIDIKTPLRNIKSDEALMSIIENAILNKPENHNLTEHIKNHQREMNQIGG